MTRSRALSLLAPVLLAGALCSAASVGLVTLAGPASAFQGNPDNGPNAAGDPNAANRCAAYTTRSFTGTIEGADGLGVNTTIGFDMEDGAGHTVLLSNGCSANGGYSTIIQTNPDVTGDGAPIGSNVTDAKGNVSVVGNTFTITGIPANMKNVWIESYTRTYTGSPCGVSCAGTVDTHKYGFVNRRAVPLDGRSVDIRLPLTAAYGGTTGALALTVVDGKGHAYPVQKEYAWSMAADGSRPDQGWGIATQSGTGKLHVASLGSGQDYVTWVYTDRGIYIVKHLPVRDAQTTSYTVNVDGPKVVDLSTLPARGTHVTRTSKEDSAPCSIDRSGAQVTFHCVVPSAAQNSVGTLEAYKYGRWIPIHRAQVTPGHKVRLTAKMAYVGTQTWRILAGSATDTFKVDGLA